VGVFLLVCALAAALFFRDPKREALHSPTHVVCPADGRVVSISEVTEDAYLQARSKRISIFMSILNVHVNFSPIGGHVEYLRYRKGTFHRANLPEASLNNENNSIGIHAGGHRVLVRQIAGTIARRIVCRVKVNDPVHPGQKIGLIQFGSRVDLFIPPDWEVLVKEGERVKGAISQIARIT
jgi:phosphatidylserine decarboxylase